MSKPKLTFEEVSKYVFLERLRQDEKWGTLEEKDQSLAGMLLVLEAELVEAKEGWIKNVPGKHSALSEIVQVAAVAFAILEQHGVEGNPK